MGQSIFGITPAVGFVADVSTTWIVFKAIQLGFKFNLEGRL